MEKTYDIDKSSSGNGLAGVEVKELEVKVQGYTRLTISDISLVVCGVRSFICSALNGSKRRLGAIMKYEYEDLP